jgi:predicted metal-dependent phosphoesterase TrpH
MELTCDLHVHSTFSDGTLTPEQLVCEAERCGLSALALCDHNTVAGLPTFLAAAEGKSVEAVPGIEFSTDYNGVELHILGLFIKPEHYETVTTLLEDFRRRKDQSNCDLVKALSAAGYVLDYESIKAATPNGQVNRAHIAAALFEHGYVESVKDAFKRLLAPKHGFYKPPERLNAFDCIRFIKSMGCVAVWAHPFLSMDGEEEVREFLKEAVPCGLDGMETIYSTYDEAQTKAAASIAEEFCLKQSGGSDFHGANKPDISMGTGRGGLHIPLSLLQRLKAAL